ncbi:nuclear transport factor 2 family protein [Streptomyces sp. NPDC004520]|uniref:nuclear transport factor 2 family protein n=1 Tax=Streptomyces sp. NPDC004520 TaxID=3364702 RepID=UPI003699FB05
MQTQTAAPAAPKTDSAQLRKVRRYYELVDAGQVQALVDLFAEDAQYHRPGYEPLVGKDQLEHFYRERRVIREGRHTVTTTVESGDCVAVHGEFNGVLHDDRQSSLRFADFFHLDTDGRFSRRDTFFFSPLV